jgi:hypothetical protein
MLFFKVILEAIKSGTLLSMDMTQKVVREKWGSFLVVYAMALQLQRAVNTGTSKSYIPPVHITQSQVIAFPPCISFICV